MSESDSGTLQDASVAILLASEGTEEVEFTEPRDAVEEAGAEVDVVGAETGEVETVNNDLEPGGAYEVERSFSSVDAADYDGVVVPGGCVGADELRADDEAVAFVEEAVDDGVPVAVICHGPWTLVEAGAADGRRLTAYHSLETDVHNAGGDWVDEAVVVDDGVITSRNPDDLDAFCETLVEAFADA